MFDIAEGANMLTKRSPIWLTVTALLIHCSAIKSRVMSWQFMAFKSSRIAGKAAAPLKIRRVWFGQNTWNGPVCRFSPYPAACFPCSIRTCRGHNVAAEHDHFAAFPSPAHRGSIPFRTDVTAANKQQTAGRAITTPSRNETTAAELIDGEITLSKVHLK